MTYKKLYLYLQHYRNIILSLNRNFITAITDTNTMNDFTERYQNFSNIELMRIIKNSANYQPLAVETAEKILNSRNLTQEELRVLNTKADNEIEVKLTAELKRKEFENKMMATGDSILSAINPIRKDGSNVDTIIISISLLIGLISIYLIFSQFGLLLFMFGDSATRWDFSVILFIFPVILPPIAAILFFMRKSLGWLLICMLFTFSLIGNIRMLVFSLSVPMSYFSPINNLYPRSSAFTFMLTLLFYALLLWIICKREVREVFKISNRFMFKTLIVLTVISFTIMYLGSHYR